VTEAVQEPGAKLQEKVEEIVMEKVAEAVQKKVEEVQQQPEKGTEGRRTPFNRTQWGWCRNRVRASVGWSPSRLPATAAP
jgi:hypothetical protein